MRLDPAELTQRETYERMSSLIVPRPIAWVSTVSADGVANLAPFSFFTGVTSRPPTVVFCPGQRDGEPKDTLANLLQVPEFVVNFVSVELGQPMVRTSRDLPPEVDEHQAFSLETCPSERIHPPRLAASPAHFECVLEKLVPIEDGGEVTSHLVVGRVVLIHIADRILDGRGRVSPAALDPLARLSGRAYARLGEAFLLHPEA